jgi:hypothetical protein
MCADGINWSWEKFFFFFLLFKNKIYNIILNGRVGIIHNCIPLTSYPFILGSFKKKDPALPGNGGKSTHYPYRWVELGGQAGYNQPAEHP